MILARSTSIERFYAPSGNNITKLEFEVYQGTDLIYSGTKINYTPTLNSIEFDYSTFARDLIQPRFPITMTGAVADTSLYVTLGFAFKWYNDTGSFGALGYENALFSNFVYGYFDSTDMVFDSPYFDYTDISQLSNRYVLMNEGTYDYNASFNAGKIFVDCFGGAATATYTGLVSGTTATINLTDEFKGVPCVHPTFQAEGNKVVIADSYGTKTFYYKPITECKYTPIRVDFINNLGGWQRTWLFKASNETITQKREQFTRGFNRLRYIDGDSPTKMFNVETMKSIKGNTGWVDEEFNTNTLEPLMNSETIFIDDKPVIIKTQSTELVKHINQKMINYTLEFDYAFNTIYK